MNYHMHNMDKSITKLLGMLKNAKKSIPKTNDVLMVQREKASTKVRLSQKLLAKVRENLSLKFSSLSRR